MPITLGTQTPSYGGKQLRNPVAALSGPGGPPSNVSSDSIIGQTTYTNTTSQAVYMLTSKNPVTWSNMSIGGKGGYPITPYVVGPVGLAGYQHIQDVINVLKPQFGAHTIWVYPGIYGENLDFTGFTFPCNVHIRSIPLHAQSSIDGVAIIGNATPPTSGRIFFENINFIATSNDVFTSSATGESTIWLRNCAYQCTSGGYLFNLLNWDNLGSIIVEGLTSSGTGTASEFVNNTGGCPVTIFNSLQVGTATSTGSTLSGSIIIRNSVIYSPFTLTTGASFTIEESTFNSGITISGNGTGTLDHVYLTTGSSAALTMSSSAAVSLLTSIVTSSNNPAIAGSGAGTLTLGDVTFTSNSVVANTLTTTYATTRGSYLLATGTNSAGASPQIVNSRNGQVAFTDTIANGAYGTLTLTNSVISSSSLIQASVSCTTVNSALSIVGIVPGSGSVAFRIFNGGSATTVANILVTFSVLN